MTTALTARVVPPAQPMGATRARIAAGLIPLAFALPAHAERPAKNAAETCLLARGAVHIDRWSVPLTAHLADGRTVRLADLSAPETLAERLPTGPAALHTRPAPDRWGRLVGDLVPEDTGIGLRTFVVTHGLAFIDPAVMPRECDRDLRNLERVAERTGQGLWQRTEILDAHQNGLGDHVGSMVFVAGQVASVGVTKRTVYLNFGENYRTDFTVIIDKRFFAKWGWDPKLLEGAPVRVRGVLEEWNGGLIRVDHPAQIERDGFGVR